MARRKRSSYSYAQIVGAFVVLIVGGSIIQSNNAALITVAVLAVVVGLTIYVLRRFGVRLHIAIPTFGFLTEFARTSRGIGAAVVAALVAIGLAAATFTGVAGFLVFWIVGWLLVGLWAQRSELRTSPWFTFSSRGHGSLLPGMIHEDPNALFYHDRRGFLWRKRLWFAPTGVPPVEHDQDFWQRMSAKQMDEPVPFFHDGARTWWWYADHFFYESEGYDAEDVRALTHAHDLRKRHKLERAHTLLTVDDNPQRREPIPEDVQRFVYRRDGGRCVKCGSGELLQFDHIIPVVMGGATTPENLQVLCKSCNREKGGVL